MVLEEKEFWKKFWLKISTKCQTSNQEICFWSKFELCFEIAWGFESTVLQRISFWRLFFKKKQILTKTLPSENYFWSFLQRKYAKIGSFVFSFTERTWEKNWNGKQFLNQKKWYECVWQTIVSQPVSFEGIFLQRVRCWINIFKTHQDFK